MSIYKADSRKMSEHLTTKELVKYFPPEVRERALRYKFARDARNFITGRQLLLRGLRDCGSEEKLTDIRYTEAKKPYLPHTHFSISHSDTQVVCALTQGGEIGIDTEKIKSINLTDFTAFFTERERADIHAAAQPLQRFFWYWTRKESIIKAAGLTLGHLHELAIKADCDRFTYQDKNWYLQDWEAGTGYIGAICTERRITDFRMTNC